MTTSRDDQGSRRWTTALLVAGFACLGIASLATTRVHRAFSGFREREGGPDATRAPERQDYSEPAFATEDVSTPPIQDGDPALAKNLGIALLVLAALGLLLLLALVIHRVLVLGRRPLRSEAQEVLGPETLSAQQARAALEEAAIALRRGGRPADAVIAAWLALQSAIARAGIQRTATQTTEEFVVAVLAGLDLPRASLEEFAQQYGQAMFAGLPLTEEDRERAAAHLETLSAALAGAQEHIR